MPPNPWKLYGPWPCHKCRYDLQTKIGPRIQCPECGTENDLNDLDAWQDVATCNAIDDFRQLSLSGLFFGFTLLFTFTVGSMWYYSSGPKRTIMMGTILICVFALNWLMLWVNSSKHTPPGKWKTNILAAAHLMGVWIAFAGIGLMVYPNPNSLMLFVPLIIGLTLAYGIHRWIKKQLLLSIRRHDDHVLDWACWPIDAADEDRPR